MLHCRRLRHVSEIRGIQDDVVLAEYVHEVDSSHVLRDVVVAEAPVGVRYDGVASRSIRAVAGDDRAIGALYLDDDVAVRSVGRAADMDGRPAWIARLVGRYRLLAYLRAHGRV